MKHHQITGAHLATTLLAGSALLFSGTAQAQIGEQEAREFATEAYIYLYPLVVTDLTRRQATNVDTPEKFGFAPVNKFQHARCFQEVPAKPGGQANLDMLPSLAWLDASKEPVVLSVPQGGDRHYHLSLLNQWSEVFLTLGSRTSGGKAGNYALVAQGWKGKLPKELERVDLPTPVVKAVASTLAKGSEDCTGANTLQDGYKATLLAQWIKPPKQPVKPPRFKADPGIDMTVPAIDQVNAMGAADYFKAASEVLKTQKTNLTDGTALLHMGKIGLEPGARFDFQKLDATVRMAMGEVPANAQRQIQAQGQASVRVGRGWLTASDTQGVFGNSYLKRASAAVDGRAGVMPEEAVQQAVSVDADNNPLKGDRKYTLLFKKNELPPAGYWSLTFFDEAGGAVGRSINTGTPLSADNDGSVTLYIQNDSPGSSRAANWLPVPPKAPFSLVLRTYFPQPQLLDGSWMPPAVERVKTGVFGD